MTGQRLQVSQQLFEQLKDKDNDYINKHHLISTFEPENHPVVAAGQVSAGQVQDTFSQAWTKAEGTSIFTNHVSVLKTIPI